MSLKRKINRLRALRSQLNQLEREILEEGCAKLVKPGERLLMKPRVERVMEMFG